VKEHNRFKGASSRKRFRNEDNRRFGDGSTERSFTYITGDLVDGIIRLMLSNVNDPVDV